MAEKNKPKMKLTKEDRKQTTTAFLMLFPSLIIAVIALIYAPRGLGIIIVGLSVYNFILLKNFIESFYKTR